MSKRRTREQKIIASLRRKLNSVQPQQVLMSQDNTLPEESVMEKPAIHEAVKYVVPKETVKLNALTFAYDPKLIKKDLIKTIILSAIFLMAIFVIQRFVRL